MGLKLPYEIEGESSLNSSYTDTFLKPGAMFQAVRIEANNARGKRIEAFYRPLRYGLEKKREGWLARPHAISETNQQSAHKAPLIPTDEIVLGCLRDIEKWNNTLHSNQTKHPGMTRWDVLMDCQHPKLVGYNWPAILSGLGRETKSTMRAGRITLQGQHRMVGQDGRLATGEALITIMRLIEGKQVLVRWLDDNDGGVLKSLVYDMQGVLICELLTDFTHARATIEKTPQDTINESLTAAYVATVQGFAKDGKNAINNVTIIERTAPVVSKRFVMPGLKPTTEPRNEPAPELDPIETEFKTPLKSFKTSTAARFIK